MTKYTYTAASFLNGKVNTNKLHATIGANAIGATFAGVTATLGQCDVFFSADLSGSDKAVLDGLIAAHTDIHTVYDFVESSALMTEEKLITGVLTWDVLAGLFTNPSFFGSLDTLIARFVMQGKATVNPAEIQVVENNGGTDVVVGTAVIPAGDWSAVKFFTTVPFRAGDSNFRVEGRLNAATTASVRNISVTLMTKKDYAGISL
jgi:hypothetical protein